MIRELIERNRSYRRFDSSVAVDEGALRELVDLARLSASGGNMQPLKFLLSCEAERNECIFGRLAWAGYLKDWAGPGPGERPTAYIVILLDTSIRKDAGCDQGIAAQSILLGAIERGLGGCMIGSVNHSALERELNLPGHLRIILVVALGRPAEEVLVEETGVDGSIEYYRDENSVHHVPKRPLDEIIVG